MKNSLSECTRDLVRCHKREKDLVSGRYSCVVADPRTTNTAPPVPWYIYCTWTNLKTASPAPVRAHLRVHEDRSSLGGPGAERCFTTCATLWSSGVAQRRRLVPCERGIRPLLAFCMRRTASGLHRRGRPLLLAPPPRRRLCSMRWRRPVPTSRHPTSRQGCFRTGWIPPANRKIPRTLTLETGRRRFHGQGAVDAGRSCRLRLQPFE